MIATFFQWRLHSGREADFSAAWSAVTQELRARGSLGSALFLGPGSTHCALARWPDRATRDSVFARGPVETYSDAMRACIDTTLQTFDLDEVANFWSLEA